MSSRSSEIEFERYNRILGLDKFKPKTDYVCFMPWLGEFGWYIMNHVKRIHGYNHPNKIICIKKGHECLFPTAKHFFYDWEDVPDTQKAGVGVVSAAEAEIIKEKVTRQFGSSSITFISPSDTSWEEKTSLAHFHFNPKPLENHGFQTDVVIAPRKRRIDRLRNLTCWQKLIDRLTAQGLTVSACGNLEASVTDLSGLKYKSWDYTDVDSDVELIQSAKVFVGQESGLMYLAMLCEKPLFILDNYHSEIAEKHRISSTPIKALMGVPIIKQVKTITKFIKTLG